MFADRRSPATATAQPNGDQMSAIVKPQLAAAQSAPGASCLQRPSAAIVRRLNCGDPAILVLRSAAAQHLLERGLVPRVPRVERGHEDKTLSSAVTMAAAARAVPMIIALRAAIAPSPGMPELTSPPRCWCHYPPAGRPAFADARTAARALLGRASAVTSRCLASADSATAAHALLACSASSNGRAPARLV